MAIVDSKKYTLTGAQVKDLASRIKASDAKVLTNAGAPTTSTVGTVGQLLEDTTNGKLYICTAVTPGTDPDPDTYTWEEVGAGSDVVTLYINTVPGANPLTIYSDDTCTTAVTIGSIIDDIESGKVVQIIRIADAVDEAYQIFQVIAARDDGSTEDAKFGIHLYDGQQLIYASAALASATQLTTVSKMIPTDIVDVPGNSATAAMSQSGVTALVNTNAGAPTTSTVGAKGQILEDTTNGKLYICTNVDETDPSNPVYTWDLVGKDTFKLVTPSDYGTTGRLEYWNLQKGFYQAYNPNGDYINVQAYKYNATGEGKATHVVNNGAYIIVGRNDRNGLITVLELGNDGTLNFYNLASNGYKSVPGGGSYSNVVRGDYIQDVLTSTDALTPLSANQGKVLNDKIEGRVKTNAGAPTTSTVGTVGMLLEDTTNGKVYICTDATNPYVWEEVGTGGASNVMVLYTNKDLPDTASSSYHIYSDVALTTTVNAYDVYNFAMAGGIVLLVVPDSRDASRIYSAKVCPLHEMNYDTDDSFYRVTFLVKASMLDAPKYYHYYGSTGEWGGKETFIDAVSPSALNSIIATNAGAPTTSTVGTVGQLLEDTTNGKLYICTAVSGSTYTWAEIDYSGLTTLSYGISTWNDFITAYNAGKIVYCRASSNTNPATGTQGRMAFMAYINNPTTPTEVEFQYVRSMSSKTASQPCDQVFVYKLTNASGGTWTVATRDMTYKVAAGTNVTTSYSNGTVTINATDTTYSDFTGATSGAAGTHGLVPAPAIADVDKVLGADGTWKSMPSVNDSTITIRNNGATVDSFTTNAASNKTISLSAPVITMTSTDPGEGGALAANNFIAVYNAS